ncbi:hypothetical protein M0R45_017203 [Rubus argutus]|uniref:RNA helicase n=1 Tax=Rubus argutus TaxID=59490 RepID=A0AAW1XVI3_RUBAR
MSSTEYDKKEKKKKMKKAKKANVESSHHDSPVPTSVEKKSKKESKKRKDVDAGEPLNNAKPNSDLEVLKTKKKSKKAKVEKEDEENKNVEEENPNAVSQFRISQPLMAKLKERGIESLFPIQAMTFDTILDGSDLVGQARTGQGKTLAFVLPILESLAKQSKKTGYRAPSAIVLLPTRNLAIQVLKDIGFYGSAFGLASCCVYGGSSHSVQTRKLKRGVDIVVGTPGRVKDQIERGNLDLSTLKFRVLDEADEMLKMGCVEHVEFILGKVDANKVQTLLFSATIPPWVEKTAPSRFLKSNYKKVVLVGNEEMKASKKAVEVLPNPQERAKGGKFAPGERFGRSGRVGDLSDRRNNRFSNQSDGGFSDEKNDKFSNRGGRGRGNYGSKQ